jgi:predicted nicotinamide N-methyase
MHCILILGRFLVGPGETSGVVKYFQTCSIVFQAFEMEEEDLCSIGFMFDAEHAKETRQIVFSSGLDVALQTIGDKPGHVQSGQYLWPAAAQAGQYLIDNWKEIGASSVIELGAGCGLSGIVAAKQDGVQHVVWTDYDNGSLQLIRANVDLNSIQSGKVHFLEWGKPISSDVKDENMYPTDGFELVIGSDLIYCIQVIEPLFQTVAQVMKNEGLFILVSSFSLDEVSCA